MSDGETISDCVHKMSLESEIKEECTVPEADPQSNGTGDEDIVNPWDVQSKSDKGVDYDKLISKWSKP